MKKVIRDFSILFLSILLSIALVSFGILEEVVQLFPNVFFLSFLGGLLYSSFFTSPLAVAVFVVLGVDGFNPLLIGFLGGLGALIADLVIFRFVKTNIASDLKLVDKKLARGFFTRHLLQGPFRLIAFSLGVLIIASPLPDEIGIALLSISKLSVSEFILVSYTLNTIGIVLIALLGRAV